MQPAPEFPLDSVKHAESPQSHASTASPEHDIPQGVWDAIRAEYRTGVTFSFLEKKYGVPTNVIVARRRLENWHRDLRDDVKVETENRLLVDAAGGDSRGLTDEAIIEAGAKQGAGVIQAHRTILEENRAGLNELAAEFRRRAKELRQARADLERQIQACSDPEQKLLLGEQLAGVHKAMAALSGAQLNVANAMARQLPLERIAYGLNDKQEEKPYEERLREFYAASRVKRSAAAKARQEREAA